MFIVDFLAIDDDDDDGDLPLAKIHDMFQYIFSLCAATFLCLIVVFLCKVFLKAIVS